MEKGKTEAFTRFRRYPKSGGRLYIPQKVVSDPAFPFKDEDIVLVKVASDTVILRQAEWWEMLDWETMPQVYEKLPEEIKQKIERTR